jgi:hypothetical protein
MAWADSENGNASPPESDQLTVYRCTVPEMPKYLVFQFSKYLLLCDTHEENQYGLHHVVAIGLSDSVTCLAHF